jgi:ABC-type bacteriocin/lantibiotic exporter with double-glycine peptidase domain
MYGSDIAVKFLKDNPKYIWTNLFFMLTMPVLELYVPSLYGKLFESPNKKTVYKNIFAIIMVLMMFQILGEFSSLNNDLQYFKFDNEITYAIVHNTFVQERAKKNGEIFTSAILGDIHRVQEIMRHWYYEIRRFVIPYIIFFIIATIYLGYLHPYLGITMVLLLISNLFLIFGSANKCRSETIKLSQSFEIVLKEMEDILSNLQSVQAEGREQFELDVIKKVSEEYDDVSYGIIKCSMQYRIIGNICLCIFLFVMMSVSYSLYNKNLINLGTLVTIFFIIRHNQQSNKRILGLVESSAYDYGIMIKMKTLVKLPTQKLMGLEQPKFKHMDIKFKNVYFKYPGSKKYILKGINFNIKNRDRIAVVGDIGSGKSTITRLIMKLYNPDSGDIVINDINYKTISHIDLFSNIGYMPQNPVLFNRSIMDNIKYGREHIDDKVIIKLLKEFDVYRQFTNLDNGLYTKIGKGGSKISGGQKQIIWFLRIFLKNPPLLVLDEPTASLDINTKKIMSRLIERVLLNKTIIMITHDEFLMKFAKRKLELSQGKIISDNTVSSGDEGYNII